MGVRGFKMGWSRTHSMQVENGPSQSQPGPARPEPTQHIIYLFSYKKIFDPKLQSVFKALGFDRTSLEEMNTSVMEIDKDGDRAIDL